MPWKIQSVGSTSAVHVVLPAELGRHHIFVWNILNSYMCSCLGNEELASVPDCFHQDTCRSPVTCQRSEEDLLAAFLGIYPMRLCCRDIFYGGGRERLSLNVVLSAGKYLANHS